MEVNLKDKNNIWVSQKGRGENFSRGNSLCKGTLVWESLTGLKKYRKIQKVRVGSSLVAELGQKIKEAAGATS